MLKHAKHQKGVSLLLGIVEHILYYVLSVAIAHGYLIGQMAICLEAEEQPALIVSHLGVVHKAPTYKVQKVVVAVAVVTVQHALLHKVAVCQC